MSKYDENFWEDDDKPGLSYKQTEYLEYLVNVRYNQWRYKPEEIDKYNGEKGTGLGYHILKAQAKVKRKKQLMPNGVIRDYFIKQDGVKCARYMCMVISRFLMMTAHKEDNLPKFDDFYIEAMNEGFIGPCPKTKLMCYRMKAGLVKHFSKTSNYQIIKRSGRNDRWLVSLFNRKGANVALFRKGNKKRSTHTYLVARTEDGILRMYDPYHGKYTGRPVSERHPNSPDYLWYIRWYTK
ncbi:MAG: hypothetical protein DRP08_04540 [Candidatus Aenigmatarchaeota archaeon]|nr:MAG: hypothetical protein DRP08_04540 [Candidatus Aenigmarchaeota archaeon]